ncbi:MAG: YraN family protein [Novosphingobium sp.]|nr:YraN family protein [Novosphingobium sp.]
MKRPANGARASRERQGRRGERLAAWWLRLKGWKIVDRRVKTPRGEVDLVARDGATLVFVEVKWRARAADLDFAIDEYRLRRVAAAAEVIAASHLRDGEDMRIDVLLLAPGAMPRHIANAWMP